MEHVHARLGAVMPELHLVLQVIRTDAFSAQRAGLCLLFTPSALSALTFGRSDR